MKRFGYRTRIRLTGPWFSLCVSWLFSVKLTLASHGLILGKKRTEKDVSRAHSLWSNFSNLLFVCTVFVFFCLCMFIKNFLLSLNIFLVYLTRIGPGRTRLIWRPLSCWPSIVARLCTSPFLRLTLGTLSNDVTTKWTTTTSRVAEGLGRGRRSRREN